MNAVVPIADFQCGRGERLMVMAGPCVIESREQVRRIAAELLAQTEGVPVNLVFKASFDKANRTSGSSFRGAGGTARDRMEAGLAVLAEVGREFELPLVTDVHEAWQADAVAEVCDILQVPAFLARQTDLLEAVAVAARNHRNHHGASRAVHVKKGQFMAPADMRNVLKKLGDFGAENVMLCERGTFFGYGRLVNDMTGLVVMREMGVPVVFDATHSVQEPGGLGCATGGNRRMVPYLARAAVAVGVDALFLETHYDPENALSDGPNMVPVNGVGDLLRELVRIHELKLGDGK